jgi:hypothetical protein
MAAIFSLQVLLTTRPFDGPLAARGRAVPRIELTTPRRAVVARPPGAAGAAGSVLAAMTI